MFYPTLARILADFPTASLTAFKNNPLVSFMQKEAPSVLAAALPSNLQAFLCAGSAGKGVFATVPWLAVFDPLVTTSATRGYYVVYLFNKQENAVYLSLNQGATTLREEFGARAPKVLRERAAFMRERVQDYATQFSSAAISLGSTLNLPRDYEAGHAFGKRYHLDSLPSETELVDDFQRIVRSYDALTHRGGLSTSLVEEEAGASLTITEKKQYAYHRRIERNSQGARLAKAHHGTTCQACCFNFEQQYGAMGADFIEAHHLRQLSQLEEGVAVAYNIATDFAVLCANCHRMIHRMDDVSDLSGLKSLIHTPFC
ncbi:MAG: MrcB family domain-containing protein [Janthinobacterium lividum]